MKAKYKVNQWWPSVENWCLIAVCEDGQEPPIEQVC